MSFDCFFGCRCGFLLCLAFRFLGRGCLFSLSIEFFFAFFAEESAGYGREQLHQQTVFFVFGQLHASELFEYGIVLTFIVRRIVRRFYRRAGDLFAECGIDRNGSFSVFPFHQCNELIGRVGIFRPAVLDV